MLLFPFPFARVFFFFLVNSNRVPPATIDSRLKRRGGEAKLEIKLFSPPPLSLSLSLLFFLFDLEKIAFGLSAHVFVSQDRKKGGYRRGDGNLLLFLFAKKKRQILDQVCDAIRPERRRRRREPLSEGPSSSFLFFFERCLRKFPFFSSSRRPRHLLVVFFFFRGPLDSSSLPGDLFFSSLESKFNK